MSGAPAPFLIPAALIIVLFLRQSMLKKALRLSMRQLPPCAWSLVWAMTFMPQRFGSKLLRCPQCGKMACAARVVAERCSNGRSSCKPESGIAKARIVGSEAGVITWEPLKIVTLYEPDPMLWADFMLRRSRDG